jgi:hypothetical protein
MRLLAMLPARSGHGSDEIIYRCEVCDTNVQDCTNLRDCALAPAA